MNTGSLFFTSPPNQIGGAPAVGIAFYSRMLIGLLIVEGLNGAGLKKTCSERDSFNQTGR
jgi:hypothetical protein